mgnify:CR=1 FL=1
MLSRAADYAVRAMVHLAGLDAGTRAAQHDIAAVIEGFAAATRLAVASGLHGVEVNAGQFSLVRQFLSGLTNQRDDEYGGDWEGRTRIVRPTPRQFALCPRRFAVRV